MKKTAFILFGLILVGGGCAEFVDQELEQAAADAFDSFGGYEMPRGDEDDTFEVVTFDRDNVYAGTTFFPDLSVENEPRIIEMNMFGEVVWSYDIPDSLAKFDEPGMDVEYLYETDTVMIVLPHFGIIEVNRDGDIVWQHLDDEISHDADRLENGNTIYVWGGNDAQGDDIVKEVDAEGNLVWSWSAEVYREEFKGSFRGGWIHTNGVQRLDDGTTMLSLRNFNMTIIVDEAGEVIWEYRWDDLGKDPHEPEILDNGNILICLQGDTEYQALEMTLDGEIVWSFFEEGLRTARDCDRLPNGNTLIQAVDGDQKTVLLEVTEDGEEVWRFTYTELLTEKAGLIYKADRVRY